MLRRLIAVLLISASLAPTGALQAQELPTINLAPVSVSEARTKIAFLTSVNPDCTLAGFASVRVIKPPRSGSVEVEDGTGFATWAKENVRSKCNDRAVQGTNVYYQSKPGFKGLDAVDIEVFFENAASRIYRFRVSVR